MASSSGLGGGTPPYEEMLERKRAALRRALKFEYIRRAHNPKNVPSPGYPWFDPAIHRWNAMVFTRGEYGRFSPRMFGKLFLGFLLPFGTVVYLTKRYKDKEVKRFAEGEISYDHPLRMRKLHWSS